jgi:hypothetical protein
MPALTQKLIVCGIAPRPEEAAGGQHVDRLIVYDQDCPGAVNP